jgi:hypothetical protein
MTEKEFLDELCRLFMEIDHDWDFGNELNGEIKSIMELCQCYLEGNDKLRDQRDNSKPK